MRSLVILTMVLGIACIQAPGTFAAPGGTPAAPAGAAPRVFPPNVAVPQGAPMITCSENGVRVFALTDRVSPRVRILLPGESADSHGIEVECPECFKVVGPKGNLESIYVLDRRLKGQAPGATAPPYAWKTAGNVLSYDMNLGHGFAMHSEVAAESDGPRFRVAVTNNTDQSYDQALAVTCVQLGYEGNLADRRLDRTWVHHADGFDLLASESPERLTQPVDDWVQSRYHASKQATTEPRDEKVMNAGFSRGYFMAYHKERLIDDPVIATTSRDERWVVATYSPEATLVWSNPDWTCHHSDPVTSLPAHGRARLEVKVFVVRGGLADLAPRLAAERGRVKE